MTFSHVLLLSKGQTLYSGPGRLAPVQALTAHGEEPCPEGYNIADWLLDIASEGPENRSAVIASGSATSLQTGEANQLNRRTTATTGVSGNSEEKLVAVDETGSRTKVERDELSTPTTTATTSGSATYKLRSQYATTYMTQFEVLAWREWLNLRRCVM